MNEADP